MAEATIFDSTIARFRLIEADRSDPNGLAIDVHIIAPGWGSSGYYSESTLRNACNKRVYPEGMHMHWDHPTKRQAEDYPARSLSNLVGAFRKDGQYLANGWDGPGVYTEAKIFPDWIAKIKAMDGHIGISHYVSGVAESGEAPDGKKGPIIKELTADPLNTVDFVTTPGAGGHYRTMFGEMKVREDPNPNEDNDMAEGKQETLTLSEIRTNHPEVVAELKKQLAEELKIESVTKDQTAKLTEAADKVKALEQENKALKCKIAEGKALEYVKAEIAKAKLPEASGKILTDQLVKLVITTEDGSIDADKYAQIVTEAIKGKSEEIAAVLKEAGTGITGNGTATPPASDGKVLKESFENYYLRLGKTAEQAKQLAEIAAGGR